MIYLINLNLVNLVLNNGLGVASFIVLIYFVKQYLDKTSTAIEEVNKSLISIQTAMIQLSERIIQLETTKKKTTKKVESKESGDK